MESKHLRGSDENLDHAFMKIFVALFIIIFLATCSAPKSETESTIDSTSTSQDSLTNPPLSTEIVDAVEEQPDLDEPPIDLSDLSSALEFNFHAETISTDNRETEIVNKLAQLVEQCKDKKYATIKMSYTHDDAVGMGKVNEDEIWYYNANRQLCAFSSTYNSARTSMSSIYICRDGELLVVSSDNEFQDEGPRAYTSVRIVSSLCPLCGLTLSKEEEEDFQEYQAYEIDQSSLDQYATDFFTKHEDMLDTFREIKDLTKMGERYSAFVFVNSDTIKYSIDSNLVNKFFKKGLTQK